MKDGRVTIAIIGAPNVGKSTFFNKMIGGRRAIVQNVPGVTRDRLYADLNLARWSSEEKPLPVTLIDTGGLFFQDDTLYAGVQKQAEAALEEADCVIFMTDGRVGVTATERQISKILRDTKKPIILLVNKLDSDHQASLASEFYDLGLGDPVPFSSLGENFGDYIDDLIEKLLGLGLFEEVSRVPYKADEEEPVKIVLLGKPNVGKSSLLNRLVGYERALVHNEPGTTRDALDTELDYNGNKILLIDTAGLRRKSKVYDELERFSIDRSIKGLVRADIAVLVIDATQGVTNQEQKLAALIQKRYKACVIVLNKWDLIEKDDFSFAQYSNLVRRELGFIDYAPLVITSAETGQRVNEILDECLRVHKNLFRRVKTGLLNTVIREIVAINDPAKAGAKTLKIYYATQVEVNPPTFAVFVNDPQRISENYLRFLEKSVRKEFDFEGSPLKWNIKKSTGKENFSKKN